MKIYEKTFTGIAMNTFVENSFKIKQSEVSIA